jgi:hypothetical protein
MAIALRHSRLIPSGMSFVAYLAAAEAFLDGLLDGETDGFAIDATDYDTLIPAAYVGGPVGGDVLVGEAGVPSYDHVPLDASNLTQAGTSPKMVHFDESPYVRWSTHNKVWTSNDFTHEDWPNEQATVTANAAVAPDGTTTAASAVATGSGNKIMNSDAAFTALGTVAYTVSVYAKPFNTNWIVLELTDDSADAFGAFFNVSAGATGATSVFGTGSLISKTITSAGNGWYRCVITGMFSADNAISRFNAKVTSADSTNPANTDSAYLWGPQIVRGYEALPYLVNTTSADRIGIPQAYDAYEDCFGILVEPAATNLITRSQEIDGGVGSWTEQNVTAAINAVAPDGSTTATTITATAGSNIHNLYYGGGIAGGTNAVHTISIYVKQGTAQYVQLNQGSDTDNWVAAVYDLTNGTITELAKGSSTAALPTASITSVGYGWYRLAVTGDVDSAGTIGTAIHFMSGPTPTQGDNGDESWTAAGTETMLVWGYQLELGTVATSYIPTLGSTVTRAADIVDALTSSIPYSTTKGTVYIDFKNQATGGTQWLVRMGDPVADGWYIDDNTAFYRAVADDNGGFDVVGTIAAVSHDTRRQITFAGATNDWDWSIDGGTVSGDTSGGFPTGVTKFQIGSSDTGTIHANMLLYRLIYIPRQVQTEG